MLEIYEEFIKSLTDEYYEEIFKTISETVINLPKTIKDEDIKNSNK
jgi:hypothetical protein